MSLQMRNVVVNTTPIISLCHLNLLELLQKLYETVYIPMAIRAEIHAKEDSCAVKMLSLSHDWLKVVDIQNDMAKTLFKSQLHDGEVEVMILGKELNSDLLIIDDRNAKNYAKYLGFNVTGTLGILLKSKKNGYIGAIRPLLEALIHEGIYIDNKIFEYCLKEAGEL